MALYQEIMSVPGLSGSWQQRQKQYYEMLGSPMGPYNGSYQQNVFLLGKIKQPGFGVAQTQPTSQPQQVNTLDARANQIIDKVPTKQDFEKLNPYSNYLDDNLTRESIVQQTGRYFTPIIEKNIGDIRQNFAQRNLSRSGIRRGAETDYMDNARDEETQMAENLYSIRDREARERYNLDRERYEKDPTTFKPNRPLNQQTSTGTASSFAELLKRRNNLYS